MVHNNVSLTISTDEAARADDEAKRRLLASKKLSLVVDLDQTIIHATVDPTVADWQKDEQNPNHEAVKDVRSFLLKDDGPGGRGCSYYIKLRPGLKDFLEKVSKIYELHIYTMGTRAYAKNITEIIDPDRKVFGDRILSRDESGSMTAKTLHRLFPVDTKMVVIIDDRGDVWKWSPNLIKVTPYDFFVGIGDINSCFLPNRPGPKTSPRTTSLATQKSKDDISTSVISKELGANRDEFLDQQPTLATVETSEIEPSNDLSALEQLVAMGGDGDPSTREAQTSRQDEALTAQLEERPLLQKQKQLDPSDPNRPRNNLLQDLDRELYQLQIALTRVHQEFYDSYKSQLAAAQGGRLGQLRGGQKRKSPSDKSDLDLVPDIKAVLPELKYKVLADVVLVFSGLVPLSMDISSTDIAILAKSFGARIDDDVSRATTHVVAARNRTLKVRKAIKRGKGRVKVVRPQWLTDSVSDWKKKDEQDYLLPVEDGKTRPADEDDDILSESESPAASESDQSAVDNRLSRERSSKPKLALVTKPLNNKFDCEDSDAEDVMSSNLNVDDTSPVGGSNEDWTAMNDELADFLGSDNEDSDGDDEKASIASEGSIASSRLSLRGKKRGRDGIESGAESDEGMSKKAKSKQAVIKVTSSLDQTIVTEGERRAKEKVGGKDDRKEGDGDGWSEFEDDLEAEMEKAASEKRT